MNLRSFISRRYHLRLLTLSVICLGLGFLFLSPAGQLQAPLTARLTDYGTGTPLNDRHIRPLNYQTDPTPTSFRNPTATPSTQSGHGKDIFFVYCMPCHGDQGQGLTDEFRIRQYPPEDVDCWKSGCHGDRPYENGFKLPRTVPVLIGAGALQRFDTAQNLYDFIRRAMPFNKPGSLNDEQYLQLSAFLMESNQLVPAGVRLDPAALQKIAVRRAAGTTTPAPAAGETRAAAGDNSALLIGVVVLLIAASALVLIARSRRA